MSIKSKVATVTTAVTLMGAAFLPLIASADQISDLLAQIAALQAQLVKLQAAQGAAPAGACAFSKDLTVGVRGDDVKCLQGYLKVSPQSGFFGPLTKAAVAKWQSDNGVSPTAGYFGAKSRAKYNALVGGAPAAAPAAGAPAAAPVVAAGSGLTVTSVAEQPASQLAPASAARVPFVKVILTASSDGDVSVKNLTVERQGPADDAAFDGILMLDEDGTQIGNSKTLSSDHKVTLSDSLVVKAGTSRTITIAANMASSLANQTGQLAKLALVAVDAGSAKVNATLPIVSNSMTINNSLTIGSITMSIGSLDPGAANSKDVGTKGYYLASVKASVGSAEDVTFQQLRWNQAGSATKSDLANVVVKSGDKEYPAEISSDGKYYITKFGDGLAVIKGGNVEFSVKADLVDGSGRTVDMDILKKADIVVKGKTFGYNIIVGGGSSGSASAGAFSSNQEPFFNAYAATIQKGSVLVSSSNKVPAGNLPVDVADTALGSFTFDVKGEPAQFSAITLNFTFTGTGTSSNVTSVKLFDENGAIVAGPKDPASGVVSWTDTWTAPVGAKAYIVKGRLGTAFVTNDAITVGTNPSNMTVKGQVTGLTISPTPASTLVNANGQTVKAAALAVSVSPTPFAQNVVRGVNGFTFATYVLDAANSGEDVRLTSIQLRDNLSATGVADELNTCILYDGATALQSGSDVVNPDDPASGTTDDTTFNLTNGFIIPKGTVKKIDLKCNVASSATNNSTHSWGTNAAAANISSSGASTGSSITESITTSTGSLMSIKTAGSFTVVKDASAPSAALVFGGKTDVVMNVLKYHAVDEAINVDQLTLTYSSSTASTSDFLKATVWDGATKIGEAVWAANANHATTTFIAPFLIPKDGDKLLTVKADLGSPGVVASTTAGRLLAIDYSGISSSTGVGQSSGARLGSTSSGDTGGASMQIVKTMPTVAKVAVPSTSLPATDAVLYRFSVAADPAGPVALYKVSFTVGSSSKSATSTNFRLFGYSDSAFSVKAYDNNPLHSNNIDCVGFTSLTNVSSSVANCNAIGAAAGAAGGPTVRLMTTASTTVGSVGSTGTGDIGFFFDPVTNNASNTEAVVVPAGATRYFELRGDLSLVTSGDTGNSITVALDGDSARGTRNGNTGGDLGGALADRDPPTTVVAGTCSGFTCANYGAPAFHDAGRGQFANAIQAALNGTNNRFIWSPMSTTTSLTGATSTTDWTNGFLVPGLPGTNLSQNTFTN